MNKKRNIIIATTSIALIIVLIILGNCLYKYFYNENLENIETAAEVTNNNADIVVKIEDEPIDVNEQIEETVEEEIVEQEEVEENKENATQEENNKKNEKPSNNKVQGSKYYIKVNYTANAVTVYTADGNGKYTVPVKAMVCSTGTYTPKSGVYKTQNKYKWRLLVGNTYGQYSTRITGQILFHSVPYAAASESTLITKYYDELGKTASLGCVRLTAADAKWIYDNCALGTQVEFYSSPNPGPLGKPSAKKIGGYPAPLNTWDPTDPNAKNPWKNSSLVNGSEVQNNQNTTQNNTNNNQSNITQNNTSNNQSNTTQNNTSNNQSNTTQNNTNNNQSKPTQNNTSNNQSNTTQNNTNNNQSNTTQNNTSNNQSNTTQNNTSNNQSTPPQNTTGNNTSTNDKIDVDKDENGGTQNGTGNNQQNNQQDASKDNVDNDKEDIVQNNTEKDETNIQKDTVDNSSENTL